MIETAWNEYRAWAKRSRVLQAATRTWNEYAFRCAILAAVLGAAASGAATLATWAAGNARPDLANAAGPTGKLLALLATVAAAATPFLGRHLLEAGDEAKWIRARATAEAIKSEC